MRRPVLLGVIYYMPAHPSLLQEFAWQTDDIIPGFPRIHRFLNFWRTNIPAVIREVQLSYATGDDIRHIDLEMNLR